MDLNNYQDVVNGQYKKARNDYGDLKSEKDDRIVM